MAGGPGTFAYGSGEGERDVFRGTLPTTQCALMRRPRGAFGAVRLRSLPDVRVERWVTAKTSISWWPVHSATRGLPDPVIHRRWRVYLSHILACD